MKNLDHLLKENEQLNGIYPYDELASIISLVLKDKEVDEKEEKILKIFFNDHIIPAKFGSINEKEIEEFKKEITVEGVCATTPEIKFDGKVFCFSGKSSKTKRSDLVRIVEGYNGKYSHNVSKDTDYLIIGDNCNPCWAYSCYGRKVEQAVSLRKNSGKTIIAHENDFWKAVREL